MTNAQPTLLFSGSLLPSVYICIVPLYLLSKYLLVNFSDFSIVGVFLSIVFASSDLGLMLFILASCVLLGGWVFIFPIVCSCNRSCILITYGGFPFICVS